MSRKKPTLDAYTKTKGSMTLIIVAVVMTAAWSLLLRMGFFAPVLGVLVPLAMKKGYEYICDGSPAYQRRTFIVVLSIVVAVLGMIFGYWAICAAMYPDLMFFAVPYALWNILTGMPEYGIRFAAYLGIGLVATLIGIRCFMKEPKND